MPSSRVGSGDGAQAVSDDDSGKTARLQDDDKAAASQEQIGSDDQWCDFLVDGEQSVRVEGEYIYYLNLHNRTVGLTESFPGDVRLRYNLHTTDTVTILAEQLENGTFGPWLLHPRHSTASSDSADTRDTTNIFAIQDGWVRVSLSLNAPPQKNPPQAPPRTRTHTEQP